jgi:hypothetical protein
MGFTPQRNPRELPQLKHSDEETEDFNNAFYLLREMTSARRLSTLARRPTPTELLWAVDTYIAGDPFEQSRERACELREAALTWKDDEDVPHAVHDAARRFFLSIGGKEPACGWENDDGYRQNEDAGDVHEEQRPPDIHELFSGYPPLERAEVHEEQGPPDMHEAMKKAAEMAQALATFLNLAAGLAAPRVWAKVSPWPNRSHLLEHTDAFLSLLTSTGSQEALVAPAARLRTHLAAWEPGPQLPPEVQQAARELLSAVGVGEPPGGWDVFEHT